MSDATIVVVNDATINEKPPLRSPHWKIKYNHSDKGKACKKRYFERNPALNKLWVSRCIKKAAVEKQKLLIKDITDDKNILRLRYEKFIKTNEAKLIKLDTQIEELMKKREEEKQEQQRLKEETEQVATQVVAPKIKRIRKPKKPVQPQPQEVKEETDQVATQVVAPKVKRTRKPKQPEQQPKQQPQEQV